MYTLNIANAIKTMLVNKIRDFICESYYKWIGFSTENSYSMKRLKKGLVVVREQINRKNTWSLYC